jgi:hypothetical protein
MNADTAKVPCLPLFLFLVSITCCLGTSGSPLAKSGVLPGELTAEAILNGEYPWPPSPEVKITKVGPEVGFDAGAFGTVPEPGVHPRLLFSPEDLPRIRSNLLNTKIGRNSWIALSWRKDLAQEEGTAFSTVYGTLLNGDVEKAAALLDDYANAGKDDGSRWPHRDPFLYMLMLDCFAALIEEDTDRGRELATVLANLGAVYQKRLDVMDQAFRDGLKIENPVNLDGNQMQPNDELNSDVWRSGRREAFGREPFFAYAYDFAYNWMNEEQRSVCRNAINTYIRGKTTMGSHMPHHFRNWNWVAIGSSGLMLTAAATLGEEGNDARVYEHTKEIMMDFLKYGWSDMGSSREAIGYTAFGLRWSLTPGLVTLARNGDNFWNWERWYNSYRWYAFSSQPEAARFISHGDGGHGPADMLVSMIFKNAYPESPIIDYVLQEAYAARTSWDPIEQARGYLMLQCVFAVDPSDTDYERGARLGLDKTFFDPERCQLITRSEWGPEAVQLQFECRKDSYTANHQHSDRGVFTLAGAGRVWAREHFRGIESRHHSVVTIDYKGQGYFAFPGEWLATVDNELATFGACDAKYAYDWYMQTHLSGFADTDQPRRQYQRWARFVEQTDEWLAKHPDFDWRANIDRTPQIEAYWSGFEFGDPRMWDEYSRPVRVPHNPVQKAFRTAGLVRGEHPYVLIIDDIRKDDGLHTYDWNMVVDSDLELISGDLDTFILGPETIDERHPFDFGVPRPSEGDPQLLVKILDRAIPEDIFQNPQVRLETIEFKDARDWPDGRSFGVVKRFVIPSFSVEPNFKVLLFPHRHGDDLPEVSWNEDRTQVTIEWDNQKDTIHFTESTDGRTHLSIRRDATEILKI